MFENSQLNWLVFEGLLPLFGSGLLFVGVGWCKYAVSSSVSSFAWREAIDSMGWLYGALTIAVQSSVRCFDAGKAEIGLGWWAVFCAIVCAMLLISAMGERGHDPAWQPTSKLKWHAFALVAVVLLNGYRVQAIPKKGSSPVTTPAAPVAPSPAAPPALDSKERP